jgi:tetratricopeptide (TPR) repeat protein
MNSVEPQFKKASPVIWISFWQSKKNIFFLAAILLISFLVYLPSLQNGFVNWDDDINIYENPYITDISNWKTFFENAKVIFTSHVNHAYNPLAILSFALEKMFYGLESPGWWHLNNIILHLICVLLVFRITLALEVKIITAAFCALLFGVHPMRVESVAWITERRDLLYGSFYLLALYYYIKSVRLPSRKRYFLIILTSFILALLSKIQAVALPLSMLLIDYYFDRKISIKLVYEKWIYFILSLLTGIVGSYFLRTEGGKNINEYITFMNRIFIASYSYIIYITKSIVPYQMVPINPFPGIIGWEFYLSAVPVISILGLICYFFRKKKKALVFGLLFFTINVMFVLQIKIGGHSFLADRYTYIAYFGLFFIYAYGFQWLLENYEKYDKLIYLVVFLILGVLGYLNFEQNKIWKNGETLWSHEIKFYPWLYTAWEHRAYYYKEEGRFKEALYDYNKSISISPYTAKAFYNRGITYAQLNMFDNALQDLDTTESLLSSPSPTVFYERSKIYITLGQYDKAEPEIEKYLNLKPSNSDMWANLGKVSRLNKQYDKSLDAFNRAIQINPNKLDYYYDRSITFYEIGDIREARNDIKFLKSKGFKDINPDFEKRLDRGM